MGIFATIEPIAIKEFEEAGYQMVIGSLVSLYMAGRGLVDGMKASCDVSSIFQGIVERDTGLDPLLEIATREGFHRNVAVGLGQAVIKETHHVRAGYARYDFGFADEAFDGLRVGDAGRIDGFQYQGRAVGGTFREVNARTRALPD